jgi:hypothetical protein
MSYRGIFQQGAPYRHAELVTRSGSLWACMKDGTSDSPNKESADWRLVVPKGHFAMHITRAVVDAASRAANESDDCSIRAIAVALQVPYSKVHEAAKVTGRTAREGWPFEGTLCVVGAFAVEIPPYLPDVRAFEREFAGATGGFLLVTKDAEHVAGAFNGTVHDWIAGSNEPLERVLAVAPSKELLTGLLDQHYAPSVAETLSYCIRHYRDRSNAS